MAMTKSNGIILAEGERTGKLSGIDAARVAADAMLRAALECYHQHDRYTRLVERPALEAEHRALDEMCSVVSSVLGQMAESYCQAAKDLRPALDADEQWWHRANALWHASREFGRRRTGGARSARRTVKHDPGALADLVVDYDLEASALLALRQAAEAYRKVRPEAW
jgi:hypothetical protein